MKTPAEVVDRLLSLHFIAGYRRVLGYVCLGLAALATGVAKSGSGEIPFVGDHLSWFTLGGSYLWTVGWLLRSHVLPGSGAKEG